jgi:hypothetical protein
MAARKLSEPDLQRISALAKRWGKIIVRQQWGEAGPGLDVDLAQMEDVAMAAVRGLLAGTLETATQQQAAHLGATQPCPDCGRPCPLTSDERSIQTRGGPFAHREPKGHCPACRRDFFPQRPPLRLNEHGYSQAVLAKLVEAGGELKSFAVAARMVQRLAEIDISARHLGRLTEEVGRDMAAERDRRVEDYLHHRRQPPAAPAPAAVAVTVDGGRILTRQTCSGQGPGVHGHGWKEDKVACLQVLEGPCFTADPHPEPPRAFLDAAHVDEMVREFHAQRGSNANWPDSGTAQTVPVENAAAAAPVPADGVTVEPPADTDPVAPAPAPAAAAWPPQRLHRTCVATMHNSDAFAKMVATEAYARNFFAAERRAFLADGQRYNWTMQEKWFPDFVPIADFIHPLAYLYAAATAVSADIQQRWSLYVSWMTACWQGRVADVLAELGPHAERLGPAPAEAPATDPRVAVGRALTYLENNGRHMDYPRYRQLGLPVTSAAVESLIKEVNYRVKGTEKFWNQPGEAEAILQVRAALLSSDDRLHQHLEARPGCASRRRRRRQAGETREAA